MPLYTEHPRKADSPRYCHTDMGIPSPHYFHKAVEYPAYGKHYRIYFHYITPKIRIDRISGSYTYVCIYYITFFTIRQGLDKMIFVCYNANRTFVLVVEQSYLRVCDKLISRHSLQQSLCSVVYI